MAAEGTFESLARVVGPAAILALDVVSIVRLHSTSSRRESPNGVAV